MALTTTLRGALLTELRTSYSMALYGRQSSDHESWPHTVRVLWPALLSSATLRRLRNGAVRCSMGGKARRSVTLYLDPPQNQLQSAALWVHQPDIYRAPEAAPLGYTPADHSWVEVTHCYHFNGEQVSPRSPAWFFVVPGSGLWINVGRTLHMREREGDPSQRTVHRALVRGDYASANELLGGAAANLTCWRELSSARCFPTLARYDSVTYPLRSTRSWRGEIWTEIISLSWGREHSFLTSHLDRIRCGLGPSLRHCHPDEPAVRMQGPACIRPMQTHPATRQLLVQNGCPIAVGAVTNSTCTTRAGRHYPCRGRADRLADAEARRLQRVWPNSSWDIEPLSNNQARRV